MNELNKLEERREKLVKKGANIRGAIGRKDVFPFAVAKYFLIPLATFGLASAFAGAIWNELIVTLFSLLGVCAVGIAMGYMETDFAKKAYRNRLKKKLDKVSSELRMIATKIHYLEEQQEVFTSREKSAQTKEVKKRKRLIKEMLKSNEYEKCIVEIEKLIEDDVHTV